VSAGQSSTSYFQQYLLPPPKSFFEQEIGHLSRPNAKGWAMGNCPFHTSKSRRSLSVNLETGGWHCFGCDSHGDLISFVMARNHCTFVAACKLLGCWRGVSEEEQRRIDLQNAQRLKQKEEEARRKQLVHDQLIELRSEIHADVAIQAETSTRLSELLNGATPRYPEEVEHCWSVVSLVLDDLRETEAEYMAMAGLEYAA
jgi:hypothetical protein